MGRTHEMHRKGSSVIVFHGRIKTLNNVLYVPRVYKMTHSQLLEGLKNESKYKTAKGGGIGARSLAHNTLRGRGACSNSGMGLGRVNKLHSLTRAYTQPIQGG
jgi:hypothetical protein